MMGWLVFFGIVAIAGYAVWMYNNLVRLRNRFKNAFAQIDVQLLRRYDLIPNLVKTAKRYLEHESETLEAVIRARNAAIEPLKAVEADPTDPEAMKQLMKADSAVTGALGRLLAIAESYPELKANENMMQLSEELTSTENRIAFSRQAYNDAVMLFNTACETFPSSFVAGSFAFRHAALFEVQAETVREAPKVDFS